MIDELLPCPFCGGSAHIAEWQIWCDNTPITERYEVVCDDDSCRGGYDHASEHYAWSKSRKEAIELLNRRAG